MIRGPVLPQLRASVWGKLCDRLGEVERGLTLMFEGIDCSAGQFGNVEGLARDAMGGAVLVLVAVDGDGLLTARAHAACEFMARVGDSLPTAVPEANLVAGARTRVLVIGTDTGAGSLDLLCRLPLPGLEVCRMETFRVAGSERLAVRWLTADGAHRSPAATGSPRSPEFEVPGPSRRAWDELRQLCERIDPNVVLDGDRFCRRVMWRGRLLGQIVVQDGELCGFDELGVGRPMAVGDDVRHFVDRLLRRYSELAGLAPATTEASDEAGNEPPSASSDAAQTEDLESPPVRSGAAETLRSTLPTRLSAEEYSALGGPSSGGSGVGGSDSGNGNIADDIARIVTAKSEPWHAQRRTE